MLAQRTVSVLFVDFSATRVSGAPLDYARYEVYVACHAWAADVVSRYGGQVQHQGPQSLLGLFGMDRGREDDAERAARAAATLHATLPDLLLGPGLRGGVNVSLRTAIDTGRVVVAEQGGLAPLVMGDAIDTATALAESAAPGDSVLSDRAFRLVREHVDTELLLPQDGADPQAAVWRLVAVHDEETRRGSRFRTGLVGRTEELGQLLAAVDRAREQQTGQLLALVGPAGIGKSRLLGELCTRIGSSASVLRTRCVDVGGAMTRSPLVDLLEQVPSDVGVGSAATEALSQLREHTEPAQDDILGSVLSVIELLASRRPVVVVIEDVQWAEPSLLDFVARLSRSMDRHPIVVCATARDEPGDSKANWRGTIDVENIVWLKPLGDAEVAALVDNLLAGGQGAELVRRRIVEAADGNPLYAEEFVAMLIDDGLLAQVDDRWVAVDLSRIEVPPTVSSLVAARLDSLPRAEARVLQRASVIGHLFYRDAVARLCDDADKRAVGNSLRRLVQRDLIRPEPNAALPDEAFRFRPVLLRETAYASLLTQDRAQMHQRCAEWLEEHGHGRLVEYHELVGYHYEQACRYRAGFGSIDLPTLELGAQAATHLAAAGRKAFARRDVAAASNLLSRAAALLLPEDATRLALLPDLAATLLEQGELLRAERLLDEALAAAAATQRPDVAERAERVLQVVHRFQGASEPTSDDEHAAPPTQRAPDSPSASWTMLLAGSGTSLGGSGAVADAFDPFAVALLFDATPLGAAITGCREELTQPRLSLTREARLKVTLAGLLALDGQFADARRLLTEARQILRQLGLRLRTVASYYAAGLVELLAEQPDAAEALLAPGSVTAEQMGDLYVCSGLLALRARAAYAGGSYAAAATLAQRAEEMAAADDHVTHSLARSVRGMSLARKGDAAAGVQLAREALWTVEGSELLEVQGLALRDLAEAMLVAGQAAAARAVLATAAGVFERKGDVVSRRGLDRLLAGP